MSCPFIERPVDVEAQIIRRALRRERVIRPRSDILSLPEEFLFERYRFSSNSIVYLNNLLKAHISNVRHHGFALTSVQVLCIALRFFANGSFLYNIGDAEHVGKSTACRAVRKVCLALKRYLYVFVKFPGHKSTTAIKEEFLPLAGFPDVIGCIDATQIRIKAPRENERLYVNHKAFHSINVQVICDAAHLITNVEAKWPGSVNDSRVLWESTLYDQFIQGKYDGILLGDRSYPCMPFLLTPYPDPEPGAQQHYNQAHYTTRSTVEETISLLKARFQCLLGLRGTPTRACDVIVACAVLHNIATMRGERWPPVNMEQHDDTPIQLPPHNSESPAMRDAVCQKHFC